MIQVMIVDDSAVVRQQLRYILSSDPEFEVVIEASNGQEAITLAKRFKPDVITMDIRMPKMDGLEAIRHIMAECPTPIVVVTSADLDREKDLTFEATKLGAVSVVKTPGRISAPLYQDTINQLLEKIRLMSKVRVISRPLRHSYPSRQSATTAENTTPISKTSAREIKLLAIGSSTGGPAALYKMLDGFPADFSIPIVIVQHISFGFMDGLVSWLGGGCKLQVQVGTHGQKLQPGTVYMAPDDAHMVVDSFSRIRLQQDPPINGHRPAVTALFHSVASAFGPNAMGIIMTGMGSDGAAGIQAMRKAGAITIAQDEASCVVFGMPKEAIALGAIQHIVPLDKLAQTAVTFCRV